MLLRTGTRYTDDSPVWITFLKGSARPSRVLNTELTLISVHRLRFAWHLWLELSLFEGANKREMKSSRRDFLTALIDEHRLEIGDLLNDRSTILSLYSPKHLRLSNNDHSNAETSSVLG